MSCRTAARSAIFAAPIKQRRTRRLRLVDHLDLRLVLVAAAAATERERADVARTGKKFGRQKGGGTARHGDRKAPDAADLARRGGPHPGGGVLVVVRSPVLPGQVAGPTVVAHPARREMSADAAIPSTIPTNPPAMDSAIARSQKAIG